MVLGTIWDNKEKYISGSLPQWGFTASGNFLLEKNANVHQGLFHSKWKYSLRDQNSQ